MTSHFENLWAIEVNHWARKKRKSGCAIKENIHDHLKLHSPPSSSSSSSPDTLGDTPVLRKQKEKIKNKLKAIPNRSGHKNNYMIHQLIIQNLKTQPNTS